jgi:phosphoglucomutase
MVNVRANPPKTLGGSEIAIIKDYDNLTCKNLATGEVSKLDFPTTSNVLQYFTADGSKVSVRPSGTEPKIKFYIEVKGNMTSADQYEACNQAAQDKVALIKQDLGI